MHEIKLPATEVHPGYVILGVDGRLSVVLDMIRKNDKREICISFQRLDVRSSEWMSSDDELVVVA